MRCAFCADRVFRQSARIRQFGPRRVFLISTVGGEMVSVGGRVVAPRKRTVSSRLPREFRRRPPKPWRLAEHQADRCHSPDSLGSLRKSRHELNQVSPTTPGGVAERQMAVQAGGGCVTGPALESRLHDSCTDFVGVGGIGRSDVPSSARPLVVRHRARCARFSPPERGTCPQQAFTAGDQLGAGPASRMLRTLVVSALRLNGFWMKWRSWSRTPRSLMMSAG